MQPGHGPRLDAPAKPVAHHQIISFALYRPRIEAQLNALPGRHLVIVRYGPAHNVEGEWVYNRAHIDDAKIVWAREIPGISLDPLLDYFRNRQVWLVEADASPPVLIPFKNEK